MLRKGLVLLLITSILSLMSNLMVQASTTDVWTSTSYEKIHTSTIKPDGASMSINWVAAKNEYESAQIIMRSDSSFTINSIVFSNLTSGTNSIASSNLKYNFVDYVGTEPDPLLNVASRSVNANTTQPIWVTVYISKTAAEGTYTGTATVQTSAGNYNVAINLVVYNVTVPDSQNGLFNITNWSWTTGRFNNTPSNDQIKIQYGYDRYTTEWWSLMDKFAQSMKEHRINQFLVQTMDLLIDGGTMVDASGTYTFNWSRFDELVQYFIDRNVVKTLEGTHLCYRMGDWSSDYGVCTLQKDVDGKMYQSIKTIGSVEANNWLSQFLPALAAHLQTKGWLDIWYQHVGDEPDNTNQRDGWLAVYDKVNAYAAGMRCGDAIMNHSNDVSYEGKMSWWIPEEDLYENNQEYYNNRKVAGDELWMYTCCNPTGSYLNRLASMEIWRGRQMLWWAYKRDIDGFLHWGWNAWQYPHNDGDPYVVYPDPANANIKNSIRHDAMRDGAEDYELFKILEVSNPSMANTIVNNVITSATSYTTNIDTMIANRNNLVICAAGGTLPIPLPNVQNGGFETGSFSSWIAATGSSISSTSQNSGNYCANRVVLQPMEI